jgi:hypothetical protein
MARLGIMRALNGAATNEAETLCANEKVLFCLEAG